MTLTALFYLFVYTAGLIKALAGKPIWGIYIYFFCFYFHAPSQWWGQALPDIRWALIASFVTLISLFMYPPKEKLRFWGFRENRWLTYLAFFVVLQMAFCLNLDTHMIYVVLLLKFIFFIFLFQNTVRTMDDIKGVLYVNLFCGAYLAYLGISTHQGGRLEGIGTPGMESANQLGQHFALVILMTCYLLLEKFRWTHILIASSIALMMYALFMTESRGVIAALGVTGFVSLFFIPKGRFVKYSAFATLGIVAAALLMGPQIMERFQDMGKDKIGEGIDKSAESRVVILKSQWEMFKDSPFVGYGHRGTLLLSQKYIPEEYMTESQGMTVRASHNVAAAFFVDHGIIGGLLYFFAIFSCGFRIFDARKSMVYLSEKEQKEYRLHAGLLAGCILALVSFMAGGMGSNNKKLEGDIWLLALAPVIHVRMRELKKKNNDARIALFERKV
tara:strand:- start:1146 stop:2480 length:1335 start_codon:yes stop_codon:yes gene_type:complete